MLEKAGLNEGTRETEADARCHVSPSGSHLLSERALRFPSFEQLVHLSA
jgi:hypothetical protein